MLNKINIKIGQNQKRRKENDMYERTKQVLKIFECQNAETKPNMFVCNKFGTHAVFASAFKTCTEHTFV